MSQIEDMEAINTYMTKTKAVTPDAQGKQRQWFSWYGGLGWYDKRYNDSVYNEARVRRNAFNLVNSVSPAERENVQRVIDTGMTTEEMSAPVKRPQDYTPSSKKKYKDVLALPIQKGSKGQIVKDWQRIVAAYPVDGKFGKDTEKLTKQWQKNHGFEPNGIVDQAVWNAAIQVTKQEPVEPVSPRAPEQAKVATKRAITAKKTAEKYDSAPTPAAKAATTISKTVEKAKVAEAGMLSSLAGLSTPVKVIGGGILAGAALHYGMKYKEKGHF